MGVGGAEPFPVLSREPDTIEGWIKVYEGLIFSTAKLVVENGVEIELDDARSILRLKVWRALEAYDAGRSKKSAAHIGGGVCRCGRCSYVFMCVRDKRKDLEQLRRRYDSHIEDITARESQDGGGALDRFALKNGLVVVHDQVFGGVDDDDVVVPSTLTERERQVVCLLYVGYRQTEIALRLALLRREVEQAVKSIREKMQDWKPSAENAGEMISLDALREAA